MASKYGSRGINLQNRDSLTDMDNEVMLSKRERWGEGEIDRLRLMYTGYYLKHR